MKTANKKIAAKLIVIGNSKGVRLPKLLIQKYNLNKNLILEETDKGVLVHAKDWKKVSWEQTFIEMAQEKEDWSDFEVTSFDGLQDKDD